MYNIRLRYYSHFVTGNPFYFLQTRATHLRDSFHSFVFRSILLRDISLSRFPHHRSPPFILLLHTWSFPSAAAHHMPSSIFYSSDHSISTHKRISRVRLLVPLTPSGPLPPHTTKVPTNPHTLQPHPLTTNKAPIKRLMNKSISSIASKPCTLYLHGHYRYGKRHWLLISLSFNVLQVH